MIIFKKYRLYIFMFLSIFVMIVLSPKLRHILTFPFHQETLVTDPQSVYVFSAQFPKDPVTTTKTISLPGKKLSYIEHGANNFTVSTTVLPSSWTKWGSNTVLNGALKAITYQGHKVKNKRLSQYENYPALEYECTNEGQNFLGKLVLVGQTLYKIEAPADEEEGNASGVKFMNSFKLHRK